MWQLRLRRLFMQRQLLPVTAAPDGTKECGQRGRPRVDGHRVRREFVRAQIVADLAAAQGVGCGQ